MREEQTLPKRRTLRDALTAVFLAVFASFFFGGLPAFGEEEENLSVRESLRRLLHQELQREPVSTLKAALKESERESLSRGWPAFVQKVLMPHFARVEEILASALSGAPQTREKIEKEHRQAVKAYIAAALTSDEETLLREDHNFLERERRLAPHKSQARDRFKNGGLKDAALRRAIFHRVFPPAETVPLTFWRNLKLAFESHWRQRLLKSGNYHYQNALFFELLTKEKFLNHCGAFFGKRDE